MRAIFNTPSNATIALAACTWLLTGCGESASSCRETRTCEEPSDQGDGGSGATDSGDGDETEKSPTSGDGDHETTGDGDETADDDDEPEPCDEGTWDHDEDPDTACQDWTTCAPGEFVSDEGTPTGDRECLPCDDGFSEEDNAAVCRPWTDCPSGVLVAGTATSDTECASRAVDVAVGDGFSCILREEGTVACWGKNDLGQLGRGDTDDSGLPQPVMVVSQDGLEPLTGVVQLSAGEAFACALRESGNVWCWGNNSFGQASLDASDAGGTLVFARPVEGVDEAVKIASATEHSCAILADSTVTCWGHRSVLVSGMDVIEYENVDDEVVRVAYNTPGSDDVLLSGVVDLGVGFQHTCVALENGDAVCWGFDSTGAVGSDVYPYNF